MDHVLFVQDEFFQFSFQPPFLLNLRNIYILHELSLKLAESHLGEMYFMLKKGILA